MNKKCWTMPRAELVNFAANEYISACRDTDTNERLYTLDCHDIGPNAFAVYLDTDNDRNPDDIADPSSAVLFQQTYPNVNTQDRNYNFGSLDYNQYYSTLNNKNHLFYDYFYSSDQLMGTLSYFNHNDCGSSITFSASNTSGIHNGFVHDYTTKKVSSAYIWHNPNGTGLHFSLADNLFGNVARS